MRLRVLLLTFISIALASAFLLFVIPDCLVMHRAACFGELNATPAAPFAYRVLQPALENLLAPLAPGAVAVDVLWIDLCIQTLAIMFIIPSLYVWLKRWAEPDRAIMGVFIFAVVYLMAYHYYFRSMSTTLEILFVVGSLALIERRCVWFVPLVLLASFNRETGLLVAAIYAGYHGRGTWRESAVLVTLWVLITAGLRYSIGALPHVLGLVGTWQYNLGNIPDALIANLLLLPIVLVLAGSYRASPAPLRRLCWVAVGYGLAIAVGGAWDESQRLILPVLPLVIPSILGATSERGKG